MQFTSEEQINWDVDILVRKRNFHGQACDLTALQHPVWEPPWPDACE